jgi:hypothetical protein
LEKGLISGESTRQVVPWSHFITRSKLEIRQYIQYVGEEPPLQLPDTTTRRTQPPASGGTPRAFPAGTRRAKVAVFTRKSKQILMAAITASHPRKSVFKNATIQIAVYDLLKKPPLLHTGKCQRLSIEKLTGLQGDLFRANRHASASMPPRGKCRYRHCRYHTTGFRIRDRRKN